MPETTCRKIKYPWKFSQQWVSVTFSAGGTLQEVGENGTCTWPQVRVEQFFENLMLSS